MAIGQLSTAQRLRGGEVAEAVRRDRLVAILRRLEPATVDPTVEALLRGGLASIEFTVDSEDAFGAIARWRERGGATVGAGTVRRVEDADAAIDAGAQFLVSPSYSEAVVERALEAGIPVVPGCFSPTEIDAAWQQGATFVKLFPGAVVGPAYLKAVLNPLRDVEIIVTGGVDETTARSFLDAGAVGVGVSTAQLGQADGPDAIESACTRSTRCDRLTRPRARGARAPRHGCGQTRFARADAAWSDRFPSSAPCARQSSSSSPDPCSSSSRSSTVLRTSALMSNSTWNIRSTSSSFTSKELQARFSLARWPIPTWSVRR